VIATPGAEDGGVLERLLAEIVVSRDAPRKIEEQAKHKAHAARSAFYRAIVRVDEPGVSQVMMAETLGVTRGRIWQILQQNARESER
jgi:hypothetical protein